MVVLLEPQRRQWLGQTRPYRLPEPPGRNVTVLRFWLAITRRIGNCGGYSSSWPTCSGRAVSQAADVQSLRALGHVALGHVALGHVALGHVALGQDRLGRKVTLACVSAAADKVNNVSQPRAVLTESQPQNRSPWEGEPTTSDV
jgi:hypothetical protein